MPGVDQLEVPAIRWDFPVERLNKVDNRLNMIDNIASPSSKIPRKRVATKMWVVGTGLTTIVVLTGLIIDLPNYLIP